LSFFVLVVFHRLSYQTGYFLLALFWGHPGCEVPLVSISDEERRANMAESRVTATEVSLRLAVKSRSNAEKLRDAHAKAMSVAISERFDTEELTGHWKAIGHFFGNHYRPL